MEAENNSNNYLQVYTIGEEEIIPSQVNSIICIFVQRGLLVAGFNASKELITIRYTGYSSQRVIWETEFFEQILDNEPFLSEPEKVRGVFILSEKNMIVPNELFKENHAKAWLKHMYYVEVDEVIDCFSLEQDRANYVMAYPLKIKELVKYRMKNATILPMAIYQFTKTPKIGLCLQSCVSNEQVCATLHIDGALLWHRVFDYVVAEDIVYDGKYLCKENNYFATKLTILFNALTAAEYNVLGDYSQYYPSMKSGDGNRIHTPWDAPKALAQQLFACVS